MLVVFLGLAAADCPDPIAALDRAYELVMVSQPEDAQTALDEARAGWACSPPLSARASTDHWQLQAMVWRLQGSSDEAHAWVASKLSEPEEWNEDFGDEAKAARDDAEGEAGPPAVLAVTGLAAEDTLWLDGTEVENGTAISRGHHLLQVVREGIAHNASVVIAEGDRIEVQAGSTPPIPSEPDPPAEPTPPAPTSAPDADWSAGKRTTRRVAFVEAGVGLATLFGGAWVPKGEKKAVYSNNEDSYNAPHGALSVGYRTGSPAAAFEISGGFTRWQTTASGRAVARGQTVGRGQGTIRMHTWFLKPAADLGPEAFAFRLEGHLGASKFTNMGAEYQGSPSVLGGGTGFRIGAWRGSSIKIGAHLHAIGLEQPKRTHWGAIEFLPQLGIQVPLFVSRRF